ncbi:MAG: ComEC/Rec2 family competence protein [Anaerolineales bacterium]|nr:ComEC/Rec2 family competence protein [Anaerolineales bacterium]
MPALWLSIAFLLGIVFSNTLNFPILVWQLSSALAFIITITGGFLRSKTLKTRISENDSDDLPTLRTDFLFLCLMSALFFFLGGIRHQLSIPHFSPEDLAYWNDHEEPVSISGMVYEPQEEHEGYTKLYVKAETILIEGGPTRMVEGKFVVNVSDLEDWGYGDRIIVQGYLVTPSVYDTFSYQDYLARSGIYSSVSSAKAELVEKYTGNFFLAGLYKLKGEVLGLIEVLYPNPEASLMSGILTGVETGIPEEVKAAFQRTGTSHIIAISGFNIAIVAGIVIQLSGRLFGRRRGMLLAIGVILTYTIFVGADAAVVRAAIMACLGLVAKQLGRRQFALNSLALTGLGMALFNPLILWDAGFQLSFAATAGIILYTDGITNWFVIQVRRRWDQGWVDNLAEPVSEYFSTTVAAQLVTLPILLYHFQRFSLISFPANLLILPIQPPIMILGGISVIVGLIWLPLGRILALFCWPFIAYSIRVVEFSDHFSRGLAFGGSFDLVFVIVYYGTLLGITVFWKKIWEFKEKLKPFAMASGLLSVLLLVWQMVLHSPDGNLHLILMKAGDGEAILIQSPGGRYLLINGGESQGELTDQLGRWLPLNHRQLDWVVVGGVKDVQLKALEGTLEQYPAQNALWSGSSSLSETTYSLFQSLIDTHIPVTQTREGHVLKLGDGATMNAISCGESGCSWLLEWENFSAWLPTGLNYEEVIALEKFANLQNIDVVLLAQNGYGPLNPEMLFNEMEPQLFLLSISSTNRTGLPSEEVLQYTQGTTLLRTDQQGWINVGTNGESLWVSTEKGQTE